MLHGTIAISGMSCDGCVRAVRNALESVPGVRVDAVTVGSATVSYDELQTTRATLVQAIEKAGYKPMASGAPLTPLAKDLVHCGCGHAHGNAHGHAHAGAAAKR